MTDSQQNHKLAGLQPLGATTEDADSKELLGGLVQEFEQAIGDLKQVLSPRGAGTPDKLATPSTRLSSSPTSVRVASPRPGKEHVSLVTEAVLDERIEQLTLAMVRTIREEITSFDSTLQGSVDALEARCEALEKKGAEQDQRLEQRLEQLGHTGGQALDSLGLLGPRLDKMSQDHQESVAALELANQQMVVRLETLQEQASMLHDSLNPFELDSLRLLGPRLDEMSQYHQESVGALRIELQRLEGILSGPAPTVESDLQKIFQEMEDLNGKLHILNQVQIQDQNDFHEVDMFQKELCQRMNDEMALLRGKVDGVTDMAQEDLMGLRSKLSSDIEHLRADQEAAPIVFDLLSPGVGAVIVEELPAPKDAAGDDDDRRWELQYQALEMIKTATNEAPPEVTEAEPGARTPPSEQAPRHNEQPPKVICGDPPPLAGGSLTARLEPKRGIVFQHILPAEATGDSEPPASPQPATFGLVELQRKMDQKLDMGLTRVDEFITRQEAKLQQLFEVGNQYSAVQQCVDELREEIGSVRGDLDELRTDKVLKYVRDIPSVFETGVPGVTE